MSEELDKRNYAELDGALELTRNVIYKEYLGRLSEYPLLLPNELLMGEEPIRCIRMFHLHRLTCKKNEDVFQKLSTVYHAAMSLGCSVFLIIDSPGIQNKVDVYMGVRAPDYLDKAQETALRTSYNALEQGILSNFPGSEEENVSVSKKVPNLLNDIFQNGIEHIASVSCIASRRDKDQTDRKEFVQGIEKLIDAMHGTTYTAVFIAEPVPAQEQAEIRAGYQNIYTALSSFRKSVWSYHESEGDSVMNSISHGISKTVTEGVAHTQSHTLAHTRGTSNTVSLNAGVGGSKSNSTGIAHSSSKSTLSAASKAFGGVSTAFAAIPAAAVAIPTVGPALGVLKGAGAVGTKIAPFLQSSVSEGITQSIGRSLGASINAGGGYSHGRIQSDTESDGNSETVSSSTSEGTVDTKTEGTTRSRQIGKGLQIEFTNKNIEEILKRIDEQLQRLQECEDYGAYSCGAYFLSSREENSLLAANTYRALMLGKGSSVERGAVNVWNDINTVTVMKEYLRRFSHPVFAMPMDRSETGLHMVQTPGTVVSGLELPLHLGLPMKSVVGLQVIDHAEFGRNVLQGSDVLNLGKLYHMGQVERDIDVAIDRQSLAKHTFITGSTGSGKSNTIYHILEKAREKNIRFLVVEPAKGEYKTALGGYEGVSVYGTNPQQTQMLKINPFAFPADTHVLEHIDRLVEIFNACWPMYAAMPAVLKESIESAYVTCGWNLSRSRSLAGRFPTFTDVLARLPEIMNSSDYSSDTKGDYTGALVTRVKSLTNGINGQLFCSGETISDEALFDQDVIVDLSRIGSMETKALIMGMLMIKLQEHRMCQAGGTDLPLRHITVLEEAHNLLRKTSSQQTQESANLQGKSVEMLSNAIAEMRTYGEGFIIADQSPALLDMAVIRNTNTKIIMRLPDQSDRELVGKAAGMNDDQITELARLELGVAAVFQNEWQEPVLCKAEEFSDRRAFSYQKLENDTDEAMECVFAHALYGNSVVHEISQESADRVKRWLNGQDLDGSTHDALLQVIETGQSLPEQSAGAVFYQLAHAKQVFEQAVGMWDAGEISDLLDQHLMEFLRISPKLAAEIRKAMAGYAVGFCVEGSAIHRNLLLCGGGIA